MSYDGGCGDVDCGLCAEDAMNASEKYQSVRDNPQPGDVAGGRDKPTRKVTGRFIDACGTPYVIYTCEYRVPMKAWRDWFHRTGAAKV